MQEPIDGDAARRLACAILARAVRDARRGDDVAALWLATDAPDWAEMLDLSPERVRQWAGNLRESKRQ